MRFHPLTQMKVIYLEVCTTKVEVLLSAPGRARDFHPSAEDAHILLSHEAGIRLRLRITAIGRLQGVCADDLA